MGRVAAAIKRLGAEQLSAFERDGQITLEGYDLGAGDIKVRLHAHVHACVRLQACNNSPHARTQVFHARAWVLSFVGAGSGRVWRRLAEAARHTPGPPAPTQRTPARPISPVRRSHCKRCGWQPFFQLVKSPVEQSVPLSSRFHVLIYPSRI
jgi:hypothetical protein